MKQTELRCITTDLIGFMSPPARILLLPTRTFRRFGETLEQLKETLAECVPLALRPQPATITGVPDSTSLSLSATSILLIFGPNSKLSLNFKIAMSCKKFSHSLWITIEDTSSTLPPEY
ncbi:hypothetical protein GQX74_007771 [Glossina fuscipes]|nr:hypothetical protein GQX74_007771 [Glossina fuscipes]